MEAVVSQPDPTFWRGRRVLVTGHTGFKGGWLVTWLKQMGAKVTGAALVPPTAPSLFAAAGVSALLEKDLRCNISAPGEFGLAIGEYDPEVVFHLAAQPLVRLSYAEPLRTLTVNVLGTAEVLHALRNKKSLRAVVVVTSDKCYRNQSWDWGYREQDVLGGHDPYSSSKACAELVTTMYRDAFFATTRVGIATVRAGNVIGGGDWAADRLIPDVVRASQARQSLCVRYPESVRPWQHVLAPLEGYLLLAERLYEEPKPYAEGWNFGPDLSDCQPVSWILDHAAQHWPSFRCNVVKLALLAL